MMHSGVPPIDLNGTLQERVKKWLRDAILTGHFQPGTRLVQADIASVLKVSLTPVREAMRDLHVEGLLQLNPRRGDTVRGLKLSDVQEMRMLCNVREPRCGALVAERIREDELKITREMQAELERTPDLSIYFEKNREFHYYLYKAARSPHLEKILRGIHDSTCSYLPVAFSRSEKRHRAGLREHRQFLDACERRDIKSAAEVMCLHWDLAFEQVERIAIDDLRPRRTDAA